MSTTLKAGWLKDSQGNKFAPKTMSSQVMKDDGVLLEDYIDLGLTELKGSLNNKADTIHEHDDRYYTEAEIDTKVTAFGTSINNIIDGTIIVKEAEHAVSADTATSATKATQDADGNVISSTYETKEDASAKLSEAKEYTDTKTSELLTGSVVENKISEHNTATDSHNDIRGLITGLNESVGGKAAIQFITWEADD